MPRVNKIKRDKAISALRKAGMDPSTAASLWKLLDLSAPLADQITALAEEDPELFGLDADGNPLDDSSDEDTRPMTRAEATAARLRGEHVEGMTYRSKGKERPSTAGKAAQENAAHLVENSKTSSPPARRWYADPPKGIPGNTAAPTRERSASAAALADKLRGNR
ncbi:hypothetical protein GR925_19265 [Streptomyces sp. HUCO-GS316]|uniref:hypothetical protein n=1 Tax=Streptomyces sp. HUCO-GS316 TaxID=2692198 RepID=UPI00136ADB7D|nr:hypothetical protein [Streptomyces sp. HUCO-GS316]MXM65534.1 hypothetical protein [Streptomyces sp. HUCO-GS316]